MFSFIRKFQQKPEPQRRAIAFWISLSITAFVLILWFVSLMVRINKVPANEGMKTGEVSPMDSLSSMWNSFLSSFRESK